MAELRPTFEMLFMGSGLTSSKDDWYDLSSYQPNPNSPIPSGKQLWLGFATFIAEDKSLIFEIRPNLPTKSLGNVNNTQLRAFASLAAGESQEVDMYQNGDILTVVPMEYVSTGVEKVWLRIRSGSATVGAFDFMVYYTIY
jgi:hypothetical protein